jgi:hypothetical protein
MEPGQSRRSWECDLQPQNTLVMFSGAEDRAGGNHSRSWCVVARAIEEPSASQNVLRTETQQEMVMRHYRLSIPLALAIAVPLSAEPVSAGFFDSLFGAPPPAEAPSPGMSVTISPSRSFHRPRPQAVQVRRAQQKPVRQVAARHGSIDPGQDEQWFLHDPTLKPGDIVVLEREVLVLNSRPGRAQLTRADFTSLDKGSAPSDARALLGPNLSVRSAENETRVKAAPEIKAASLAMGPDTSSARR